MKVVFRFRFIAGILKADAEQGPGIFPVQLFLGPPIAFLTVFYEFFETQDFRWIDY